MPCPRHLPIVVLIATLGCGPTPADDDDSVDFDPSDLPQGADAPRGPTRAVVDYVYDGDTAEMLVDGFAESVRFVNIDTPETDSGNGYPECWATEATDRSRELLPEGQEVWLTWDGELRDGFGRLLSHIFVGEEPTEDDWVNLGLVREGHAVAYIFSENDSFRDEFEAAQQEARNADRGLWGGCR